MKITVITWVSKIHRVCNTILDIFSWPTSFHRENMKDLLKGNTMIPLRTESLPRKLRGHVLQNRNTEVSAVETRVTISGGG